MLSERLQMNTHPEPNNQGTAINLARGIAGAVLGGMLGWFAFFWIAKQGFYMLALPGGLLGTGAGLLMRQRSVPLSVVCGVGALALGTLAEWRFAPFRADASLGYFLAHLHDLRPLTLIMIGLGGLLGFWIPFRSASPRSIDR
jgi:F0F1-type ATP synthase assembly protein I